MLLGEAPDSFCVPPAPPFRDAYRFAITVRNLNLNLA